MGEFLSLKLLYMKICETFFFNQTELSNVRLVLANSLNNNPEVTGIINQLDFAFCTYLLSVLRLEKLR